MSDDRRIPRRLPTDPITRSAMERRAREQRERESVPETWDEDITGRHEGEELARLRARRETKDRLARLEVKHDELANAVGETRVAVARVEGQLEVLPELVTEVRDAARIAREREHIRDVSIINVEQAKQLDRVEARRDWRKLVVALVSSAVGGGLLWEAIKHLVWG